MLDLPAIKAQAEAASPGPWEHGSGPYGWDDGIIVAGQSPSFGESGGVIITNSGHGGTSPSDADAEFIAAARTNVPALVEALEEAQGKLKRIETEACACDRSGYGSAPPFGCIVHGDQSVIARRAGGGERMKKLEPWETPSGFQMQSSITRSQQTSARIADLEAESARLQGKACLICGRGEPCELDTNKDNDPTWPGSPCTFDPSPINAARRFMQERDRLKERVEAAETAAIRWVEDWKAANKESDGYKAQSERRKDALEALSRRVHHREGHPIAFEDCQRADCYDARAAIEEEEASHE